MEYRKTANSYLSKMKPSSYCASPLLDVREMLVADKVQNRKDFEKYHVETHPRSYELSQYFHTWMEILGVSEEEYGKYRSIIS